MADAVTTKVLFAGTKKYVVRYNNISDGTGESLASKLDISTLTNANGDTVTAVTINKIWSSINGMSVSILTDHTTDLNMFILGDGCNYFDFTSFGGIPDTGTGGTGDVLFTTTNHSAGDTYCIIIEYGLQ